MIECLMDVSVHLDGQKNKCYYCCIYCNEKEDCEYVCSLAHHASHDCRHLLITDEDIVRRECNNYC